MLCQFSSGYTFFERIMTDYDYLQVTRVVLTEVGNQLRG